MLALPLKKDDLVSVYLQVCYGTGNLKRPLRHVEQVPYLVLCVTYFHHELHA